MNVLRYVGCTTLREGVFVAAVFYLGGIGLTVAARYVVPKFMHLDLVILMLGFILLVLAPIVLVATFFLSILPATQSQLEKCDT